MQANATVIHLAAMKLEPCIVCNSLTTKPLLHIQDRHYGIRGEFDLVECSDCGLVRLNPMPSFEELAALYAQDYYAYKPKRVDSQLKRIAKKILRIPIPNHNPTFVQPGILLDVGCGSGEFLHTMRAKGWEVKGVEPSSYGAAEGRSAGLDIFNGTLHQAQFTDATFDYVRSNHSFEHVTNPVEVIAEMYRILKPGGTMFMGIPNSESWPYRMLGKYWWFLGPLHPYTYGVSTISLMLQRAGFKIEKVFYNSNFASVTGSIQIYLNRNDDTLIDQGRVMSNPFLMLAGNAVTWVLDRCHQGDAIEIICRKPS